MLYALGTLVVLALTAARVRSIVKAPQTDTDPNYPVRIDGPLGSNFIR